jgi:protease PrsW
MTLAALFAIALAPALFWFWFFARRDRNPEPAWLLLRTFAWGMAMVLPAVLLESAIEGAFGMMAVFLLVGLIEEGCKFLAALSVVKRQEFDEPIDGLIYATAAALGFATLENVLYLMNHGAGLIFVRGSISTLGHILFAGTWGYAMSLKRFSGGRYLLRRGWLLAALLHTIFNSLLLGAGGETGLEWLLLPFVGLMIVMWRLTGFYYAHSKQFKSAPQTHVDNTTYNHVDNTTYNVVRE